MRIRDSRKILLRAPERLEEIKDLYATMRKLFPNFLSMLKPSQRLIKLIYSKRSTREKDRHSFRLSNEKSWPHNQENIFIFDPEKLGEKKFLDEDIIHTELVIKDIVLPEKIREMQITMDLGKVFPKMEDFEYCCETNRVIIKFNNNQDTYRGFKDG